MAKFRVQTHGRLQEWVADEKGYFRDEGLDYEFMGSYAMSQTWSASVQSTESAPPEVKQGAYEDYEEGRTCEISSACHWAVNMASASNHGRMWGHAYTITPSGIYVPPVSPTHQPEDLADVEVGVGYHSGSHFSALQALESVLAPASIRSPSSGCRWTASPLCWIARSERPTSSARLATSSRRRASARSSTRPS